METQISQVGEKVQLVLASGVINSLTQHHLQQNVQVQTNQIPNSSSTVSNLDAQLNMSHPFTSSAEMLSQSTDIEDAEPEVLQQDNVPLENNEVEVTDASVEIANTSTESAAEQGLLSPSDIVPIYVKSCSRRNFFLLFY